MYRKSMDVGHLWLAGDQLIVAIHNDEDQAVADLRLRLQFGSGDDRPWSVLSGIKGYETNGTLILEPSQLVPGEHMKVVAKVPGQRAEGWSVSWNTENGVAHYLSGGIDAG